MKKYMKKAAAVLVNRLGIHLVSSGKKETIPVEEALRILNNHSPDPGTSPLWKNRMEALEYDLSIVIPVYNVEKYLEKCMQSVLNQKTAYSYRVIAVNDGSTDRSGAILDRYKGSDLVTVISQQNRGLSGARNTGLRNGKGRYVMFLDSDDYLTENAVQTLMEAAYRQKADIVQGGYYDIDGNTESVLGCICYGEKASVPPNGVVSGMAWGKVYKAQLFENVCFPEGYWFEDTIVTGLLTHLAETIATVSDMVYYYRRNNSGITRMSVGKPKSLDTFWVHRCVLDARKELGMGTDKAFYEHLLRMMVLCHQRTQHEPEAVKRSLFVLLRALLEDARGTERFSVDKRYRNLEKAILRGEYGKYCLICKVGLC